MIAEGLCAGLLAQRAGGGFRWAPIDSGWLIAVDTASGRIAGAIAVTGERHEIGGWLAPEFRGRGLGRELFHGAVIFAHCHLAVATVLAGAERTNTASVGALLSAGFVSTTGPAVHRLPNGRTAHSQWFRHDTDEPRYCRIQIIVAIVEPLAGQPNTMPAPRHESALVELPVGFQKSTTSLIASIDVPELLRHACKSRSGLNVT